MALDAIFDAWLNLSHREKASVFVMVSTNAITGLVGEMSACESPRTLVKMVMYEALLAYEAMRKAGLTH